MPTRAPPMPYDRAQTSLDRHATCIVAAFIAGAVAGRIKSWKSG